MMPGRFRPTRQRAAVGLTTAAVAVFAAMAGFIGLGGRIVAHATQCATGDGGGVYWTKGATSKYVGPPEWARWAAARIS